MKKVVLLAAALVVALGITASSATSAASETGITNRTIVIGGTFPLTGPASPYGIIPAAMKSYFSYINSRKGPDGRRGIYGRQIVFKYYDDGYNPANSVQLTRKLVEEDKVFAVVGSLGTEVNLAIRPYLNARKVPTTHEPCRERPSPAPTPSGPRRPARAPSSRDRSLNEERSVGTSLARLGPLWRQRRIRNRWSSSSRVEISPVGD